MSATAAAEWWRNQTAETRESVLEDMEKSVTESDQGKSGYGTKCDDSYENDVDECQEVGIKYGSRFKRACEETAATRLAQCLRGIPEKDRRKPQTEF